MVELSKAGLRAQFMAARASRIAGQVDPAATPWGTTMPLSKFFGWYLTADRLVVVGCPGEGQADLDLAFAFGLGHAGDRELVIVLPEGRTEPTRRRLPWIDVPVRLFAYMADDRVDEIMPLSPSEVLATYHDKVVTDIHTLDKERSQWVAGLVDWAASRQFDEAHRPSYLAWHVQGRMVLRIKRASEGLIVTAGVHHSAQFKAHPPQPITAPLTSAQLDTLQQAASKAAEDKIAGIDVANAEHELQETLAKQGAKIGLTHLIREFPAFRPVNRRGYIDFLAVGTDGNLHVVETKIGADPMLAIQGLDYWIWATAHRHELISHFVKNHGAKISKDAKVLIDFVVVEKAGRTVSPYTAAQVEAFDGAIGWRFHTIEGSTTGPLVASSEKRRESPSGDRAGGPRYAVALENHLLEHHEGHLTRRVFFTQPGAGILPSATPEFEELTARGLLHGFVDHVRSSQAFALNLFAGLDPTAVTNLWQDIDPTVVEHTSTELEYSDPHDALGEAQTARPHSTQVDVLLRGRTADGSPRVALIEVKLSEVEFGPCSAFEAAANDHRDCCTTAGPWGGDTKACFQLRNHGTSTPRRYDQFLKPAWVTEKTGVGCPFRMLNQPMRNVALARVLIDRGETDAATFCLCAPAGNTNVWRQWRDTQALFAAVPQVSLVSLPAERVVELRHPAERDVLRSRYGLTATAGP